MTSSRKVRIGLIGCGRHMTEVLLPCLRLNPGAEVVAVTSLSGVTATEFAKTWRIPRVASSWHDYLTDGVDGIVCSGPVQLHQEVALSCAKNQVPLFVEKPIATDRQTLEKIGTIRNPMVPLQIGYNLRFSESLSRYKDLIARESVSHLQIDYHANKPKSPLWGLDSLLDSFLLAISVHPLSAASFLLGPVTDIRGIEAHSESSSVKLKIDLEHGDKSSQIRISNASEKFTFFVEGQGRNGDVLAMPDLLHVTRRLSADGSSQDIYAQSQLKPLNYASGYFQQMNAFIEDIQVGKASYDDVAYFRWIYDVFDAIAERVRV